MVHLLLFNGRLACGAEGRSSSLIQLVNCGRCHAWHQTAELAKSLAGFSDFDQDEAAIDLVLCSCGCGEVFPMAEARWDELDNLPYVDLNHMADHQWEKEAEIEDAFEQANRDRNARIHAEHRRQDG
jgi:hypothetical protein